MMAPQRRSVYVNPDAQRWQSHPSSDLDDVYHFHKAFDGYKPTDLIPLDDLAEELGVGKVYVKHEGSRLGLPSFKILGASWGTYRAVIKHYSLPQGATIETIRAAAAKEPILISAATDGNHGRAVALLAKMFGLPVKIYTPASMDAASLAGIRDEGAEVISTLKSYDGAIAQAAEASHAAGGLLIQDCAFEGYEEVPDWIVNGYTTCLREIDEQLNGQSADLVAVPVGVGSLAEAVVSHYRREGSSTAVMAVEPDTAACLWKSLKKGESVSIKTTPTIMAGLDCGTVSTTSWPILKAGIGSCVTVADQEVHKAALDLNERGIRSGPCGAASLAALRRLTPDDKQAMNLGKDSVVVLLSTEAGREYTPPRDVLIEDPGMLTEMLINIHSATPRAGRDERPVETSIAQYVMAWLEHRDIECHWLEQTPGRPSVVGAVRGSGKGKSLMLSANLDVKPSAVFQAWPSRRESPQPGIACGDGAANTKGGVAANMLALAHAKSLNLSGDVILAATAGGEDGSIGTQEVLKAGWHADGVIVTNATGEDVVNEVNGAVKLEVDIYEHSASSLPLKIDPVTEAAHFLVELDKRRRSQAHAEKDARDQLQLVSVTPPDGAVLDPGLSACTVFMDWNLVGEETAKEIHQEIQSALESVSQSRPSFRYAVRTAAQRNPCGTPASAPFVAVVYKGVSQIIGRPTVLRNNDGLADCAVLVEAGLPTVAWGPIGASSGTSKTAEEWVDVESVRRVVDGLVTIAKDFCG